MNMKFLRATGITVIIITAFRNPMKEFNDKYNGRQARQRANDIEIGIIVEKTRLKEREKGQNHSRWTKLPPRIVVVMDNAPPPPL